MSPPRGKTQPAERIWVPDDQTQVSLSSRQIEQKIAAADENDEQDAGEQKQIKLSTETPLDASFNHQEPLTGPQAVLVFLSVVFPNMIIVGGLSTIGYGMENYNRVAEPEMSQMGDMMLCGATFLAAVLIVFDWWYMHFFVKAVTALVPFGIFCLGSMLKGRKYPWGIVVVCLASMPLLLGIVRFNFCKRVQLKQFYAAVSGSALVVGLFVGAVWGWYVFMDDHKWDSETQYDLIDQADKIYQNVYVERALNYTLDCGPDRQVDHYDKNVKADLKIACSQAGNVWFLAYMNPGITIGCDLFISMFCLVNGVVGRIDDFSAVQRHLTRFMLGVAFILSGMYATASMSAVSIRLGSTLMAFFTAGLCLLCIWVYSEIDHEALKEAAHHSHLMKSLIKIWNSEWTKAAFCCMAFFPCVIFITLNLITQKVRIIRGIATDPDDKFTPTGRWLIDHSQDWPWTRIIIKICIMAELFFTLQVGVSKVTYVFLSWLNTSLEDTSFSMVLILVYIIGCTMFLLPPVPGLPVYLFAGILIGAKGLKDDRIGFWFACGIATVLSLFTKLCACTGQYMIGYFLGKSIKVQQLIGVDKVPTRAIEMVLKSRGLNPGKVSVLVGGPDWPTSVTCGIVHVNVPQMLLGTIPVITLLAPCILAGACMGRVKPGEEGVWNMAASCATAAAAVVNMASMAYAVYTIGEVIEHHGEELAAPRPEHEAVAELTRREQASVDMYNETIRWQNLGQFWKGWLCLGCCSMMMSNAIFVGGAEYSFRPFAVSSRISDPYELDGLNGAVMNIILFPVGAGALALFFFGAVLHIVFSKVMGRKAAVALKASGGGPHDDEH